MKISYSDYQGDFDSLTDEEIEWEVNMALDQLNEAESWLEAVAAWKADGKPRSKGNDK